MKINLNLSKMTTTTKVLIGVGVLAVIGTAIYIYKKNKQ